MQNFKIFSRN